MLDRDKVIKILHDIGNYLAEQFGYDSVQTYEDRQKGIWGESVTKYLEERDGPCTEECYWFNKDDDKGNYIEFRYRFSTPCLGIHKVDGSFCEIEISNWNNETSKYDGEWRITEVHIWEYEKSKRILDMLISMWKRYSNEEN